MTDRELTEKAITLAETLLRKLRESNERLRESDERRAAALAALDEMTIEAHQLRELAAAEPHGDVS